LGIPAKFRPRNDIEVNGRKISGTGGTAISGGFMFQGTVQSINAADSSVTIRTDFGRTVVLSSQDCRMADGLRSGDRVRLEPDATGLVTVTPMDRRRVGGEASSPEFSRHLAWAPVQCSEGVI